MTNARTLVLCDCAGTMPVDETTAAAACGATAVKRCSQACTEDLDVAARALEAGGKAVVACGQEAARFITLAEEIRGRDGTAATLITADIRDRAGWCAEGAAHAKQAALLAEAMLVPPMTRLMEITSAGTCLIIGPEEIALQAAERLAGTLAVTCLLESAPEEIPPATGFDLALGRVVGATGYLGNFSVRVDGYAAQIPSGRGPARFAVRRDGARSECDIILDLGGDAPLFPAAHRRDGYLRADPGNPLAVERALFEAAQLTGTFEKPFYTRFEPALCAHSRSGQAGCRNCLDACPSGAITSDGNAIYIDPGVCAGCGDCAAVCPSGAIAYDDPEVGFLFRRLDTLSRTFREIAGHAPRLLFHDAEFGTEMIVLAARFGRGLPPEVIPVAVPHVEGLGHAELLAALGCGFSQVSILATPRTARAALEAQLELARAISGAGEALRIIEPADPDALEEACRASAPSLPEIAPIRPQGSRREVARLAASALRGTPPEPLPLPAGAPYGTVEIDAQACTLCLACVSLCPTGALGDNPDKPQVTFRENACLQCGICASGCPENAIALSPRLDLSPAALAPRVLHEEEPFACIECGKPFGTRSAIERIIEKLEGRHRMFTNSDNARLIRMCDDCRVRAQYHDVASPFRMGEPPRPRTTEDYLDEDGKD